MKVLQLALLCFIFAIDSPGQTVANSYAKITVEIIKQKKPKKIYSKVEVTSAFPGGDSAWIKSLENKLNQSIPFRNGAKKGKYIASVAFIVTKDGNISDILCITDPGFGMCDEVVRALKKSKKWTPTPAGGIRVREYRH